MTTSSSITLKFGGYIASVPTLASLRNYRTADLDENDTILVAGASSAGDNNGGAYIWLPGNSDPDNGTTIIAPTNQSVGRWKLSIGRGNIGLTGDTGPTGDVTPAATAAKVAAEAARDASATSASNSAISAMASAASAASVNTTALAAAIAGTTADRTATAADRTVTAADRTATAADRVAVAADRAIADTKAAQAAINKTATDTARDQAVAAAASVDTTAIANAKAATAADRIAVRADKLVSDTNASTTVANATIAQNAANASSNRKFFLNKAAAIAAFSGLANGTAVEVNADESRSGLPSLYYKDTATNSGALIYARSLADQVIIFYVDNLYGNDANDGLTPRTAVKSLARLGALCGGEAFSGAGKFGVVVRLNRNSRWNGEVLAGLAPFCRIESYGQGEGPIIDASVPLLAGWTAVAGRANLWYQDITFAVPVIGAYPGANCWHAMLFDEAPGADIGADGLPRILNGDPLPDAQYDPWQPQKTTIAVTSQAALLDILEASPIGGFTVFKQGSTSFEPRIVSGDGDYAFRVYLKTADGTNPNTNGRTVYINQMNGCASLNSGCIVDGITFARAGSKDGFSAPNALNPDNNMPNLLAGYTVNCKFLQHGGHATVDGGMSHYFFLTRGGYVRDNVKAGCGSLHGFRSQSVSGITPGRVIANGRFERTGIAVYTHGSAGPPDAQHTGTDITDCTGRDVNQFAVPGQTLRAPKIIRCTIVDCDLIFGPDSADKLAYIEDSTFTGRAGAMISMGATLPGTKIIMTRSIMKAGVSGTVNPLLPDFRNNLRELTPSTWPVLEMRASKIIGRIPNPGNVQFCQIGIVMDGASYLGIFDSQANDPDMWIRKDAGSPGIVAAAGARIECRSYSIETLRTRFPGVASGVETGVRQQIVTKTLTSTDFTYSAIGGGVTADWSGTVNGDGTATLATSFNYGVDAVGRFVRIAGAGAAGADYFGRVAAFIDGATIKVSPAPPAAFTNKALVLAALAPIPRNPVNAYVSADGTQINVPVDSPISVGQTVRVGKVQASGASFGIRKVTARSGQVATLDAPCVWKAMHDARQHSAVTNPLDENYAKLPAAQLSFGMSFVAPRSGQPTANYSAVKVEGGTVSGSASLFNIDYENGYWSGINGLAAGDVLTLTSLIDVPEFRGPQGAAI